MNGRKKGLYILVIIFLVLAVVTFLFGTTDLSGIMLAGMVFSIVIAANQPAVIKQTSKNYNTSAALVTQTGTFKGSVNINKGYLFFNTPQKNMGGWNIKDINITTVQGKNLFFTYSDAITYHLIIGDIDTFLNMIAEAQVSAADA